MAHGISPNVASFIGAATPRVYVLRRANRAPTPAELDRMREVTAKAMEEGALGVASALIYQPGNYAKTDELIGSLKSRRNIEAFTFRTFAMRAITRWRQSMN